MSTPEARDISNDGMYMRPSPIEVSIVIVNWNSVRYLRPCLESIYRHAAGIAFEIVVVDNASYDGSEEFLRTEFPAVQFIQSDKNLGFAAGNNLAFRHSRGDFVLFLNPDTEMIDEAVADMTAHLKSDPTAGAAGCRLLNSDRSTQWVYTQAFPTITNQVLGADLLQRMFPRSSLWGLRPMLDYKDHPVDAEVLAGSCLMVKRAVFEKVRGFDEDYYMYADDVDLCYKIRRAGLAVRYVGSSRIVHHGGASSAFRRENDFATVMQKESMYKFFRNTQGSAYARVYKVAMGGTATLRLALILGMMPLGGLVMDKNSLSGAARKWWSVLRWATGRERWAVTAGHHAPTANEAAAGHPAK
jgi:GT2 family glycosyltransferase